MQYLKELFGLEGKSAIVLGGTGTLPGTMAEGLARAGASVTIVGRNGDAGQSRVNRVLQSGGIAEFIPADACCRSDLERVRDVIMSRYGRIDILVNGVGGNHPDATVSDTQLFPTISENAWQTIFETNVMGGLVLPCQVFGECMVKQRGGSIINIASVSAHCPLSRVPAYSAAKAAVVNLTKFLAREWASFNVRVNTVSPGFFPAKQNMALLYEQGRADGTPTERGRAILHHTPMRRMGTPQELVGAVILLASERASSFITGTDIRIDGGFTATTV